MHAMTIGVLVCDCQGQVSDRVDTEAVVAAATGLAGVALAERLPMLCDDRALGGAVRRLFDRGCDRVLFAGCSPRSSLKFPEERIARVLAGLGGEPDLFEVANLREQCAWQHGDRSVATAKAIDLVAMAHARLRHDRPTRQPVAIPRRALVVGAGAAGLQVAKDLASAGIAVTLVDRARWLGGQLCRVSRLFQCEGWPSVCDAACVGVVQAKGVALDDTITALTATEVGEVVRAGGRFRVTLESAPRFVDPVRCTGCGACAEACPETAPRAFDGGASLRKAIDKEFERAVPDVYDLIAEACTRCGACVTACPTEAIDLDAVAASVTDEFGAVFLATGTDPVDLSGYGQYLGSHPDVITSMEFERLLDQGVVRPSDGEEPESVVFVQCAGSRAGRDKQAPGVEYCSKTCCSVTAKQVDRLGAASPMAEVKVLYYRDLRTYERALEGLYQQLRSQGYEFVNGDLLSIEPGGEQGLQLTVNPLCDEDDDDDDDAESITLDADLVVLAAAQTPARGARELYRKFGVELDRHGFPIENQPRIFRPTESLVNRVFAVGSSVGPKVVQQAAEQGSAAAMRALPGLLGGAVPAPRFASQVDPGRCTGCRICVSVCPHGAISMTEQGIASDPGFCQACGLCAAACPVHAAELDNFSDRQLLEQVAVGFAGVPPGEPRLLALLCYWCAYSAADFAGIERRDDVPANHRVVRIRCSSSVNTALLLQMFKLGVDGILVGGCPERSCHHLWGNFVADKRIELARALMGQVGLESARLRFEYIGAPMHDKLVEVLRAMDSKLRTLGSARSLFGNPAAVDPRDRASDGRTA